MPQNILDLSKSQLGEWLLEKGLKKFALGQILQWLYQRRVRSFEEMSNLSKETRRLLSENFVIHHPEVSARHRSEVDGSTKYLFRLIDHRSIEGVLMPQKNRITLCISSQVGCAMGCTFCRTAEMKLVRNLTQGEILGQILVVQSELSKSKTGEKDPRCKAPDERGPRRTGDVRRGSCEEGNTADGSLSPVVGRISNIVMMGMGEPFHNYEEVIHAIELMTCDRAIGISQRKITVSTVGLAPEIERFGRDTKVKLALSLNATTEEGRLQLMPITRRYPLQRVIAACRNYTQGSRHKVTFEYVMMAGINDSMEDAKRLAQIGSHVPCKINLIPYNEYPTSPYKRPTDERIQDFFRYLADRHFQVNIRYSKGQDVMAACGQLCSEAQSS